MVRLCLSLCLIYTAFNTYATINIWQALRESFKINTYSREREVRAQINYLRTHPDYFNGLAINARPYLYYILETIKKDKLPGELALLPLIESNYNPFAYSKAGAAGLWQLMPETGSNLGVRQNWWYDGRRGIMSSTKAALNYLKYLNHFFAGDWILAFAAYDSGEGTVLNAIKYNQRYHRSTRFWSLPLPKETQAYLPKLLAIANIIKNPRYYGVNLPNVPYTPYFKAVPIKGQIDLTIAAKLSGMRYQELLSLNPGHNRWATAPNVSKTLLLPIDKVSQFIKNQDKAISSESRWRKHQVATGDTLGLIANHYQTDIQTIKSLNSLTSDNIRVGQSLILPNEQEPKTIHKNSRVAVLTRAPHKVIHVVQKKETIQSIAKHYAVSVSDIVKWNKINQKTTLKTNQSLVIWNNPIKTNRYIVKPGDSLSQIAYLTHMSLSQLKHVNHLDEHSVIKPNQVLKVS